MRPSLRLGLAPQRVQLVGRGGCEVEVDCRRLFLCCGFFRRLQQARPWPLPDPLPPVLTHLGSQELHAIVEFAQTTRVRVQPGRLVQLLQAARQLEVHSLVELIERHLAQPAAGKLGQPEEAVIELDLPAEAAVEVAAEAEAADGGGEPLGEPVGAFRENVLDASSFGGQQDGEKIEEEPKMSKAETVDQLCDESELADLFIDESEKRYLEIVDLTDDSDNEDLVIDESPPERKQQLGPQKQPEQPELPDRQVKVDQVPALADLKLRLQRWPRPPERSAPVSKTSGTLLPQPHRPWMTPPKRHTTPSTPQLGILPPRQAQQVRPAIPNADVTKAENKMLEASVSSAEELEELKGTLLGVYCVFCEQQFTQNSAHRRHYLSIHMGLRYPCLHCSSVYTTHGQRTRHMDIKHQQPVNPRELKALMAATHSREQRVRLAERLRAGSCAECDFQVAHGGDWRDARAHYLSVHLAVRYECYHCPKVYPTEDERIRHANQEHLVWWPQLPLPGFTAIAPGSAPTPACGERPAKKLTAPGASPKLANSSKAGQACVSPQRTHVASDKRPLIRSDESFTFKAPAPYRKRSFANNPPAQHDPTIGRPLCAGQSRSGTSPAVRRPSELCNLSAAELSKRAKVEAQSAAEEEAAIQADAPTAAERAFVEERMKAKRCPRCNFVSKDRLTVRTHYLSKHLGLRYACWECDKWCYSNPVRRAHFKEKHSTAQTGSHPARRAPSALVTQDSSGSSG